MTCVQDPLPQPAGNFFFALGFRDVLLAHEHRFVQVKEGQLLWQTASPFNYDAWVVDVQGNEVLVMEASMGAVHVLSLATGSLLYKWQAPADGEGFNRAMGTSTWPEAVQGRCKPKRPGQDLWTPQGPVPQGFHPHWRAIKGALALDDGTAALLPSGRILVITGPSSSDLLYCQGPMRAFLLDRNTGTVTRSWLLADLLGEPRLPADASGPKLTLGPAGPWYVCTNRGCSPLKLEALCK